MKVFRLYPATMGLAALATKCFPLQNINPGEWLTPMWVRATEGDVQAFIDLVNDLPAAKENNITISFREEMNPRLYFPSEE